MRPIVILDDEKIALTSMHTALRMQKFEHIVTCQNQEEFWRTIGSESAEVVLLDLIMPKISGENVLERLKAEHPTIPVIVITGVNELETAVRCMRNGAFDYITKPVSRDDLKISIDRAIKFHELEICNEALSDSLLNIELKRPDTFSAIITADIKMLSIFKYIEAVAPSSYAILVTGETGTGKELIAKAIHQASQRQGNFVAVNVAGLDDATFSDALFGHKKGAFTGANDLRKGFIEEASKGTLFLDEIGDLSMSSQVKLLRLLQENEYIPLGSDTVEQSNCRIIAATSRSLTELNDNNKFRKDLYYRLRTHHVHLPPLKERKNDLPLLVPWFLQTAAKEFGKKVPTSHNEIFRLLSVYNFPGNIRELRAIIYDAVAKHQGRMLSLVSIKEAIGIRDKKNVPKNGSAPSCEDIFHTCDTLPTLKQTESYLLKEALKRTQGNKTLAANMMGISPSALSQRLSKLR